MPDSKPLSGGDTIVTLFHGTSEGHLAKLLAHGFTAKPQTATDSVRSVIADHLPGRTIDDKMVQTVMQKGSRLKSRSDESNSGSTLFTTSDQNLAMQYAAINAQHGGEFGAGVHQALRDMGHFGLPPRFDGARPVLLALKIPLSAVHMEPGMQVVDLPGIGKTVQSSHEVFINNTSAVEIAAVTFARGMTNDWDFGGQKSVSPAEAKTMIAAKFSDPGPAPGGGDPLAQRITETVYNFRNEPDVATEHVDRKPVAAIKMYLDGGLQKVRIPDPRFQPRAAAFAARGFENVAEKYKLPGGIGARELDAYLNVLDAKEQHGGLNAADKQKALKDVLDRVQADNPALAALGVDANDPRAATAVLRGVAHGHTVADIGFSLNAAAAQTPDYAALKKSAGIWMEWNPAPETIASVRTQMDRKMAAFEAKPTVP